VIHGFEPSKSQISAVERVPGWYRIADVARSSLATFGRKADDVRFVGGCLSAGDQ